MRGSVAHYERPFGAFSFACTAIWLLRPIHIWVNRPHGIYLPACASPSRIGVHVCHRDNGT
jgi:hypothetical protein